MLKQELTAAEKLFIHWYKTGSKVDPWDMKYFADTNGLGAECDRLFKIAEEQHATEE